MQSVAFAAPILPGRTDDDREAMRSCSHGERKVAFESSRARHGITREAVWIQPTPAGDVAVVYIEGEDLQATFTGLGSSQEPFDSWFRAMTREIHGIDLEQGFPPPEQLIDFRAARTAS
ncbi:MAG: hypothetical protein JOZ98_08625 [Solirubrobacterales bacterium]|nr:hypothetical protein [Solirubrobacterales bacterium]MBV9799987.1 hypothetical protein [Solirubrobacterales bacterium]